MRRALLMMRTRSLITPLVKNGNKAATTTNRKGVISPGTYIRFKQLNP